MLHRYSEEKYDSTHTLVIKHFGHPINNWGFEVINKDREVVAENKQVSQYEIAVAAKEGANHFNENYI